MIAEELTGQMRPRFDVVERPQVKALLEEMKADANDLTVNETSRTEFGKLAKARYVVLGSVSQLGGIHVNARLVDTDTGLIRQTARIVAATPEEMSNRLPALGRMLQMTDDEKRNYEAELAKQAQPVAPPPAAAEIPAPPPPPPAILAAPAPAAPPPPADRDVHAAAARVRGGRGSRLRGIPSRGGWRCALRRPSSWLKAPLSCAIGHSSLRSKSATISSAAGTTARQCGNSSSHWH